MIFWELINSPIILTVIGLLWGSIVASWITALWQKRSHRYTLKLQLAQNILKTYHEYVRIVRSNLDLQGEEFNIVHSQMLSQVKIAGLLFKDKRVGKEWKSVVGMLANVRSLYIKQENTLAEEKIEGVFDRASIATEWMFKELS